MSSTSFHLQDLLNGDVAQLQTLFTVAAATLPAPKGLELISEAARLDLVKDTLDRSQPLTKQLPALLATHTLALAPALHLRVMLADKIFHALFGEQQLDPALDALVARLTLPFCQGMAQDDSVYSNAQHPLRQLLNEILARGVTWYPRDAKPHQMFYDKLQQLLDVAAQNLAADPTGNALTDAIGEFRQWADAEEKRAQMLETRLCETEVAHLKLLAAECQVLDLLNHSLAGQRLPIALIDQLPTLKSALQHCLINEGSQATFWKAWQRTLPTVGQVFATGDDMDEQQLYRDIPVLLSELERNLHYERHAGDGYQDFIDTLGQHLMQAIQKKPMDCQQLPRFAYPDGSTDSHTRVTAAILQQAQTIAPGDWIMFTNEDGQILRCKLAIKIPDVDQLLFVDRSGRKVMAKNMKDFSLCLSTGVARWLKKTSVDEVFANALKQLIALGDKHAEQHRLELERQQALEAAAKRVAAEKALAEARALAAEKQQRELAAKAAEEEKQQQDKAVQAAEKIAREKATLTLIDNLNVGAWIEVNDNQHSALRCKLSVIISSTGKYIFVDQVGRKAAEYQRERLIEQINAGQITVISKGDKFEDQLVKVIRGLRKDIS